MIVVPRPFNILQMTPVKTQTGPDQTENQTEVNKNVNHLELPFVSHSFGIGRYLE